MVFVASALAEMTRCEESQQDYKGPVEPAVEDEHAEPCQRETRLRYRF